MPDKRRYWVRLPPAPDFRERQKQTLSDRIGSVAASNPQDAARIFLKTRGIAAETLVSIPNPSVAQPDAIVAVRNASGHFDIMARYRIAGAGPRSAIPKTD